MDGRFAWEAIFGTTCLLCRQRESGPSARLMLCPHCLADLPWSADPVADSPQAAVSRQIAPLEYRDAPRSWVLAAKHDSGLIAARVLGLLLAEALLEAYPQGADRPALIIPAPLSRRRLISRGHNQAALIARPAARELGLPLDISTVTRIRHTGLQPGRAARARAENVAGAFHARRRFDGMTLAIVDDVVTTGATAASLAHTLLAAGAVAVHLWCPTRAPPPAG